MGWKGRGRGMWPGRGPFSYLPPWQRPGWVYGRGACWWLFAPYLRTTTPTSLEQTSIPPTIPPTPFIPTLPKEQEIQMLENQTKILEQTLKEVTRRLEELKKASESK